MWAAPGDSIKGYGDRDFDQAKAILTFEVSTVNPVTLPIISWRKCCPAIRPSIRPCSSESSPSGRWIVAPSGMASRARVIRRLGRLPSGMLFRRPSESNHRRSALVFVRSSADYGEERRRGRLRSGWWILRIIRNRKRCRRLGKWVRGFMSFGLWVGSSATL